MQIENFYYNMSITDCLNMEFKQSLRLLINIIGEESFSLAKKFQVKTPVYKIQNSNWLKHSKIVGINPRLVNTYWGIVKYAMTFPENAIHLMPLFETGDGSLYSQNSWQLNPDFYDKDLESLGYDSCEKQLKFVINILHAMNKVVGFDALPHVDNFSEIVILNPSLFEWVKLNKDKTSEDFSTNRNENYRSVENLIIENFNLPHNFFQLDEISRHNLLFPNTNDEFNQRMKIRKLIRENGYEPIPVVEHSPMRPIKFEKIQYSDSENWAVFDVLKRNYYAKIIGSITPYSWYEVDDFGYIKKNAIKNNVWNYFIEHINNFQKEYNFDFLRADMGHNQIAHAHNEKKDIKTNEFWAQLKNEINKTKPYFATFAEAFFSTYYIDAHNDMINKKFDVILGNLNFQFLSDNYTKQIREYIENNNDSYVMCNTIYTNDGDLPTHQKLYQSLDGNILRYFMGLFLNLPSYMGIGFEQRNLFPQKDNEYSNYYVKKQNDKFIFGSNFELFNHITELRKIYGKYNNIINNTDISLYKTNSDKIFAWSYNTNNKKVFFVANFDSDAASISIQNISFSDIELIYSNTDKNNMEIEIYCDAIQIKNICIGGCAIYECY